MSSVNNSCCDVPNATNRNVCPLCGQKGRPVDRNTVHYHVRGAYQREIIDVDYYFLPNPDCEVVYFTKGGDHVIKKDQLRNRVGLKEKEDPIPLCYCFNFDRTDVQKEITKNGQTTIPDFIRGKVQAEACACEAMNPSGRCCLGNVLQAVKEIQNESH